jgi:hypothetical protein
MRRKIRCDGWKRKYFGFAWEVNTPYVSMWKQSWILNIAWSRFAASASCLAPERGKRIYAQQCKVIQSARLAKPAPWLFCVSTSASSRSPVVSTDVQRATKPYPTFLLLFSHSRPLAALWIAKVVARSNWAYVQMVWASLESRQLESSPPPIDRVRYRSLQRTPP